MSTDWLSRLRIGDEVAVSARDGKMDRCSHIGRVKYMGSQVILVEVNGKDYVFSHTGNTGYSAAAGRVIRELTPELRAQLEKPEIIAQIKQVDLKALDMATLRQVLALVQNGKAGE